MKKALFKDIGDIKNESKDILKTPVEEEDEDGKDFKKPKHRVTESTPLSRKTKTRFSSKRKKSSRGSTLCDNGNSKRIRPSEESNKSVDLFSSNESISVKDIEEIEKSHIDVPTNDVNFAKTISLSSHEIEGELSPSLTASMINEHLSGESFGKQIADKNFKYQEELSPACVSSSILNQRFSFDANDEKPCNSNLDEFDQDTDVTLIKPENPSDGESPCGGDLDKCISETFYESAISDENCVKTLCGTKLFFNDSEFTKNESALMKLELTDVESLYNSYPQNTFYGLPLNVREILIQTRGISKLYGEF